jgi:hypothetical protein
MIIADWLSIAGAGAGALGSIVTAFSLNRVFRELDLSRQFLEVTLKAVAGNVRNIPVFEGLDDRMRRASAWSSGFVWLGVLLLVAGWMMQGVGVLLSHTD